MQIETEKQIYRLLVFFIVFGTNELNLSLTRIRKTNDFINKKINRMTFISSQMPIYLCILLSIFTPFIPFCLTKRNASHFTQVVSHLGSAFFFSLHTLDSHVRRNGENWIPPASISFCLFAYLCVCELRYIKYAKLQNMLVDSLNWYSTEIWPLSTSHIFVSWINDKSRIW